MEKFGGKCDLKNNEVFGRFIVANRDIGPGDLLLLEKPTVVGPIWGSKVCCLNCFNKPISICKKCQSAPLCTDCPSHNPKECEFFIKYKLDKDFINQNFNVITPIRFLCVILDGEGKIIKDHEILKMESHIKERKDAPLWKYLEESVVKPLMKLGTLQNLVSGDFLQEICGILDVNTFDLRNTNQSAQTNQTVFRGLFPNAALLTHDCIANTFITLDHENSMRIFTSRPVKKDEIITYNYTKLLYGTEERQRHVQEGKYFTCSCERCKSPTELGTYLSSVACSFDCDGLCSLFEGKWICEKCLKEQDGEKIKEMINKAKEEILMNDSLGDLERLIPKYTKLLNKNHWLVVEAKQNLIALLRMRENLKHNQLIKKLKYCEEVNELLQKFEPCISRLRGISLYETFKTLNELCQVEFESDKITEEELRTKLLRCEELLKESIENLLYEPMKSPEGQLMRFAMTELRYLRAEM